MHKNEKHIHRPSHWTIERCTISKKFEITVKLVLKFMKIYKECAWMHINDLVNLFQNLFREIMTAIRYSSNIVFYYICLLTPLTSNYHVVQLVCFYFSV